MAIEEGTAIPGSEPGTGGKGSDTPTDTTEGKEASGAPSPDEAELDDNGKPLPFDQHPKWKAARQAEKSLQKLMADNDVEDLDDLIDLVQSGKKVIGKIDPDGLDEIIDKASTLARYEEYWDRQKEEERMAEEEPEETAARLAKENAALKAERNRQKAIEENQKALRNYDTAVLTGIKEALPTLPPDQGKFLAEFMGVGNPALDVEITNKAAVTKVVRDGVKKFEKLKQQIIKDYLAGKDRIVDVPRIESGGVPGSGEIKTLKDARKTFLSMFK